MNLWYWAVRPLLWESPQVLSHEQPLQCFTLTYGVCRATFSAQQQGMRMCRLENQVVKPEGMGKEGEWELCSQGKTSVSIKKLLSSFL